MRMIEAAANVAGELLSDSLRADYVYMYPPRQAYRPIAADVAQRAVASSLARDAPLNVYVHVPFCKQLCAFCNLYTVGNARDGEHSRYVDAVTLEIQHYASMVTGRAIDTIYIGGGTPSTLDPLLLERLLGALSRAGLGDVSSVPEVAIEVAPDTATPEVLQAFLDIGINRINLGVQSWNDDELALIGRKHGFEVPDRALQLACKIGFDNVCVDLIYGLQGQTDASWEESVHRVIAYRPPTVCCYPLTLRPITAFASRGYTDVKDGMMYERYDLAHQLLLDAGYQQETHVRWVLPGLGGYRQKSNHWAGQDVIGFGAGARSYLWECDTRNGYSMRHRRQALSAYYDRVCTTGDARTDGFPMDADERRRKDIILGLGSLSREQFFLSHGCDVLEVFPAELSELARLGAISIDERLIALTPLGQRHRDVLVQLFFSKRVRRLVAEHIYAE